MNKFLSVTLLSVLGILSLNSSCKKADGDPVGNYACTCFVVHRIDSVTVVLDTVIINEDMVEKSVATTYCANAQAAYTDTFGSVGTCTLK